MSLAFSAGEIVLHQKVNALVEALGGIHTLTGMQVTEKGAGANMSVDVSAGHCISGGTFEDETATVNKAISNGDATNDRYDLITYDISGNDILVVEGTASATPNPPAKNASGDVLLAIVLVQAAEETSITNADIYDLRVPRNYLEIYASGPTISLIGAEDSDPVLAFKEYQSSALWTRFSIGLKTATDNDLYFFPGVAGADINVRNSANNATTFELDCDTGSILPNGNKVADIAAAGNAYDDIYADDFQNEADYYWLDEVKDIDGKTIEVDDLEAINNIKPSDQFDERSGMRIIDDNTLPEWILSRDKKDPSKILRSDEGKPYLSSKAMLSLALGAIRKLTKRLEVLEGS